MSKRKFSKCVWCGGTIDITNSDRELCETCAKYPSQREMEYAQYQKKLNYLLGKKSKLIEFERGTEDYRKAHERPCLRCDYNKECLEATKSLYPSKRLCWNIIQFETKKV